MIDAGDHDAVLIERLAAELNWIQQRLDPSDDGDWETFSDAEKEFFRQSVKWLLAQPEMSQLRLT